MLMTVFSLPMQRPMFRTNAILTAFITIILSFLCLFPSSMMAETILISSDIVVIDGRSDFSFVQPGDTLMLAAGERDKLIISNLFGSSEQPIIIINEVGGVDIRSINNYGIYLLFCQHLHLTGSGDPALQYGIVITSETGIGIKAEARSSFVEIDHIEIKNIESVGLVFRTEPTCPDGSGNALDYDNDGLLEGDPDDADTRDTFVQRQTSIHDMYIHNIGYEGIYVGSSFYDGKTLTCSDGDNIVYPPNLDGVNVYYNRVDSTGWDGIQIGSAVVNCNVHHNVITNDSYKMKYGNMSGIMLNQGSSCDCFNNFIHDGEGVGIFDQGNGENVIYNNIIVNNGLHGDPYKPRGLDGIFIAARDGNIGHSIYIFNNTIIRPKNNGITFGYSDEQGDSSRIQNNIIVDPGSYKYHMTAYGDNPRPERAFIEAYLQGQYSNSNNYFTLDLSELLFVDTLHYDYSMNMNSPVIDSGTDVSAFGVTFDFFDYKRPERGGYDIGAIEYPVPSNVPASTNATYTTIASFQLLPAYPNPFNATTTISFHLDRAMHVALTIYNIEGKLVRTFWNGHLSDGNHAFQWHGETQSGASTASGIYVLRLKTEIGGTSAKVLLMK
ncbi:right-handed parallel beta-helix repeat-containing protein [candidate division KSB1 bacterium]|nr:right-handed parallel beta-helix repeat-containing protein [candidate division KSB1 bacterium]